MKEKLGEVVRSRHFITQIIGIVLMFFASIGIVDTGVTAEDLYDLFTGTNGSELVTLIVIYVATPLSKLYTKFVRKEVIWDYFKTDNFKTMLGTILTLIAGVWLDEQIVSIVVGVLLNLLNIIGYSAKPSKMEELKKAQSV